MTCCQPVRSRRGLRCHGKLMMPGNARAITVGVPENRATRVQTLYSDIMRNLISCNISELIQYMDIVVLVVYFRRAETAEYIAILKHHFRNLCSDAMTLFEQLLQDLNCKDCE